RSRRDLRHGRCWQLASSLLNSRDNAMAIQLISRRLRRDWPICSLRAGQRKTRAASEAEPMANLIAFSAARKHQLPAIIRADRRCADDELVSQPERVDGSDNFPSPHLGLTLTGSTRMNTVRRESRRPKSSGTGRSVASNKFLTKPCIDPNFVREGNVP